MLNFSSYSNSSLDSVDLRGVRKKETSPKGKRSPVTSRPRKRVSKDSSTNFVRRLTDTGSYTGTHKHRFDRFGKGLGLDGRDSIAKGSSRVDADGIADYYVHPIFPRDNVHDLSMITRPDRSKPGSKSSRAKKNAGRLRHRQHNRTVPGSSEQVDGLRSVETTPTVPSVFLKLTDEEKFTGTHRKHPLPRNYSRREVDDDDTSQPDASWSNLSEVGSPTSSDVATRAEIGASHRSLHNREKSERREADEMDDQTSSLGQLDLDTTETHGDDSVALLVTVRQQQAGMAALTDAIHRKIEKEVILEPEQVFDVKTDYTKKQKSVCMRIGTDGIEFLDSRATMNSLAVLPFSSLGTWTLTKPGRVALTLQGSEKPVTVVSKHATTIIQELNIWAPVSDSDSAVTTEAKVQQVSAGATIAFSRRFGSTFLGQGPTRLDQFLPLE